MFLSYINTGSEIMVLVIKTYNVDWIRLQNQFRQQYSKIGNTTEELLHAWRSFHFDENTET